MTAVTIELPDDIARSAQQAGLLRSDTLGAVVRELVRQRAGQTLEDSVRAFEARPVAADELSVDDIRSAIDAARRH